MNRFSKLILITAIAGWHLSAQDRATFIDEAKQSYREVKDNILKSAEEMPAEDYDFRPTPGSRAFGRIVRDIAASQTDVCSAINGKSPQPYGRDGRAKVDLVEALKQSIRECNTAYRAVTPLNAGQQIGFGAMAHSKLGLLFLNAARDHEAYGQLAVYWSTCV
jgi:hypothetical protein